MTSINEQHFSKREQANKDFSNPKVLSLLQHPNVRMIEPYYDITTNQNYPTIKVTLDKEDNIFSKSNSMVKLDDRNIIIIYEIDKDFKLKEEGLNNQNSEKSSNNFNKMFSGLNMG